MNTVYKLRVNNNSHRQEGLSTFRGHMEIYNCNMMIEIQDLEGVYKKMSSLGGPTKKEVARLKKQFSYPN